MKKTLLSIAALALCSVATYAEDVTLEVNNINASSIKADEYLETTYKDDGSVNAYAHWNGLHSIDHGNGYTSKFEYDEGIKNMPCLYTAKEGVKWTVRLYNGTSYTFTATTSFKKITFVIDNGKNAVPTCNVGVCQADGSNVVWQTDGDAVKSVTFTFDAQMRYSALIVSAEAEPIPDPEDPEVIDPTPGAAGKGTIDDPLNIARAYDFCIATGQTVTKKTYYISGYVVAGAIEPQYGNATWTLADSMEEGAAPTIQAFRVKGIDGKSFTEDDVNLVKVGDKVTVYAPLVNYKGNTPETNYGQLVSVEPTAISKITVAEGATEVFTLNGVKVAAGNLQKGVYVVSNGGKAHKVLVK